MAQVQFRRHTMHDYGRPQIVEEAFKVYAAFSGIHDFNFDDLYTADTFGWSSAAAIVAVADGDVTLDASAEAAGWYAAIQQGTELPTEILVKYHKTVFRQAVVVGYQTSGLHYIVGTDDSGFPTVLRYDSGTYTTVLSIPRVTPEEADVMVSFREFKFSDSASDVWHSMSVWMNDALVLTHTELVSAIVADELRFGFAAYGGDAAVTYSDVEIPEITEFAEWSSLDPGEEPMGGLQRGIEGRYLKFFLRFDGSLRAWKPKASPTAHIFEKRVVENYRVSFDKRALKTHVRQVGAYDMAEYIRTDLWPKFGHTFVELNNPYLMTQKECYREARKEIQRMEQQAITENFSTSLTPLIEPEDRIETPSGDRIISSISLTFTPAQIEQSVTARIYNYEL